MKKILIAYFSLEHGYPLGITHEVAQDLAKLTGGDLFKIEPVTPYPSTLSDINKEAARKKHENARPPLVRYLDDVKSYQIILLAYPNYWGTMPMEVCTFLESLDLTDQKIYPVCTHEGSGLGHSVIDLTAMVNPDRVGSALAINRNEITEYFKTLEKFVQQLEL